MFSQRKTISSQYHFPVPVKSTALSQTTEDSINYSHLTANKPHVTNRIGISIGGFKPAQRDTFNASIISGASFITARTNIVVNSFNVQTKTYINTLSSEQMRLSQSNDAFLSKVYSTNTNPSTRDVRNYGDWSAVKKLVVRDELMKIQIGGKTDLPLTDSQYSELAKKIDGLDLSNMNDPKINTIINDILHPSEQVYMDALKTFKTTGKVSDYFQAGKLEQLQEYLENIDLNKITGEEFKKIVDNFIEKTEIHHRTSISSDPTQQSNIDNLDTLSTSQHDAKHTDPETDKINYRRKLSEAPLDRKAELESMNRHRVLKENLTGLGIAVAIGLGTGFAIGFVVSLAQNGINPNSIKYAFAAGARQGGSSAVIAAGGYLIGKTIGAVAGESLTKVITSMVGKNATEQTLEKISQACNTAAVGILVTIAFSVYEFAKLKRAGYSTKECLLRVGKTALLSISVLCISIVAVWAGCPGIAVSIVAGVIMTGYSVVKIRHDKKIAKEVTLYSIELCRPSLQVV